MVLGDLAGPKLGSLHLGKLPCIFMYLYTPYRNPASMSCSMLFFIWFITYGDDHLRPSKCTPVLAVDELEARMQKPLRRA